MSSPWSIKGRILPNMTFQGDYASFTLTELVAGCGFDLGLKFYLGLTNVFTLVDSGRILPSMIREKLCKFLGDYKM